jgi:hypothetical protein
MLSLAFLVPSTPLFSKGIQGATQRMSTNMYDNMVVYKKQWQKHTEKPSGMKSRIALM